MCALIYFAINKTDLLLSTGKDDIFGGDVKEPDVTGKSLYSVRPLTYCDINKIDLADIKETLNTYPEFAHEFMNTIQVTFNLKRVSGNIQNLLNNHRNSISHCSN